MGAGHLGTQHPADADPPVVRRATMDATQRLFFALLPEVAAATRMRELALQMPELCGVQARSRSIEHLHLTLCFLGNHTGITPQQLAAADAAGRSLQEAAFELTLDLVESLGQGKGTPLVLSRQVPCAPLIRLHDTLTASVRRTGLFNLETRPFKPHVTLLYGKRSIPAQAVAPISWTISEVLLIQSWIGRAHHDLLGRYPLVRGSAAASSASLEPASRLHLVAGDETTQASARQAPS